MVQQLLHANSKTVDTALLGAFEIETAIALRRPRFGYATPCLQQSSVGLIVAAPGIESKNGVEGLELSAALRRLARCSALLCHSALLLISKPSTPSPSFT